MSYIKKTIGFLTCLIFLTGFSYKAVGTADLKIPPSWVQLKKELKKRKQALTSVIVHKKLDRIHRVMNQKNSEEKALVLIKKLEVIVQNRPFDLAKVQRLKAQVYLSKDDFKQAGLYFQKALDLKVLSFQDHLSVLYDMASLYLYQDQLQQARRTVDKLFYLADEPSPSLYILKAFILIEKNQKKQALKLVRKALAKTPYPKESWLVLAVSLELEMKNYVSAVKGLAYLTAMNPEKKKYWKQLSAVYLNINKDDKALSALDLAYKMDFLEKEREILHLASLLMHQGQPFKAGRLLEKSLSLKKIKPTGKNLEMLGDCWSYAEESKKALRAYEQSALQAKDGRIFSKTGFIYFNNEDWSQALKHFTSALKRGGLKQPAAAYIYIGMAYFHLNQPKQAVEAFEQVISVKSAGSQSIKTAREWINAITVKKS